MASVLPRWSQSISLAQPVDAEAAPTPVALGAPTPEALLTSTFITIWTSEGFSRTVLSPGRLEDTQTLPSGRVMVHFVNAALTARCCLLSIATMPAVWIWATFGPWPGKPTWMPVVAKGQLLVILPAAFVSARKRFCRLRRAVAQTRAPVVRKR